MPTHRVLFKVLSDVANLTSSQALLIAKTLENVLFGPAITFFLLLWAEKRSFSGLRALFFILFSVSCDLSYPFCFVVLRVTKSVPRMSSLFYGKMWIFTCTSTGLRKMSKSLIWRLLVCSSDVIGRCGRDWVKEFFGPFWWLNGNRPAAHHPPLIWMSSARSLRASL